MEESVKRRERLKAMRVEASQTGASYYGEASSGFYCLSNPLVETSTSLPAHDSSATPRFDYYTDPLSAFSGNKKRSMADTQDYPTLQSNVGSPMMPFPPSHQGAWNPAMTPPAHQLHSNYAHNPRMYPPQPPPYNSGPQGMPMGNPFPMHQPNRFPSNPPYYPDPGYGQMSRPGFGPGQGRGNWINSGPQGMPMGNPFPMHQPNRFPSNPPYYPDPGFGQMSGPGFGPGQGRGNWISQNPGPDSEHEGYARRSPGRGRGHHFAGHGMNPGPEQSGGGRRGNPAHGGRAPGPERLYHKSMIEDPWKFCQPVKWKSTNAHASCSKNYDSSQPWLPKSISSKTTRVPEASKSRSGPSLAESLAASLYETVDENDKQGM